MFMHGYSVGGWMWLVPAVTMVLFWGGVYLLARSAFGNRREGDFAIDILKKRYARGELSKEEFEEMKRDM